MQERPTTPITDLLNHVVGAERIATRPGRHPGGEWDTWLATSPRTRRSLTGAGWARARGMAPDELADIIRDGIGDLSDCDAIEWYIRHARLAIVEARELAAWKRQQAARPTVSDPARPVRTRMTDADGSVVVHSWKHADNAWGWATAQLKAGRFVYAEIAAYGGEWVGLEVEAAA